jgi:hypothetical protein
MSSNYRKLMHGGNSIFFRRSIRIYLCKNLYWNWIDSDYKSEKFDCFLLLFRNTVWLLMKINYAHFVLPISVDLCHLDLINHVNLKKVYSSCNKLNYRAWVDLSKALYIFALHIYVCFDRIYWWSYIYIWYHADCTICTYNGIVK